MRLEISRVGSFVVAVALVMCSAFLGAQENYESEMRGRYAGPEALELGPPRQDSTHTDLFATGFALQDHATSAANAARWTSSESDLADSLERFARDVRSFNHNLPALIRSNGALSPAVRELSESGGMITRTMRGAAISKQVADRWSLVQGDLGHLERVAR